MLDHLKANWRTSVQSVLTVVIGLSGISIPAGVLTTKQALWWGILCSVAKVLIGLMQTDAGTTLATLPGNPETVAVASHEVPDNLAAKAIK